MDSPTQGSLIFNVAIDKGWHMYAFDLPDGGPISTQITLDDIAGVQWIGSPVASHAPTEKVDMIFHLKLGWWDSNVTFTQAFKLDGVSGAQLSGTIRFQGCNDKSCIPPTREPFAIAAGSPAPAAAVADTVAEAPTAASVADNSLKTDGNHWWDPVDTADDSQPQIINADFWHIFIWGFAGGLIALLTPLRVAP